MSYIKLEDGSNIFYKTRGRGHVILCIHGFAADHNAFRLTEKTLGKNYKIISLDLRGHGKSDRSKSLSIEMLAKDLQEIIKKLALKDFSILAWSMGGAIALEYIKKFGTEKIKNLILVETTFKLLNDESWEYGLFNGDYTENKLELDLKTMDKSYSTWARKFLRKMAPNLSEKDFEIAAGLMENQDKDSMISLWKSLSEKDYSSLARKIDIPTLIVNGEKSEFYGLEAAEKMAEMIKRSQVEIVSNAGHLVPLENPIDFAKLVREFTNEKR